MNNNNIQSINTPINDNRISVINLVSAIIAWIITVVWLCEIFRLSAETGDQSSLRSAQLLFYIQTKLKMTYIDETLIRDFAHVVEFAVLSLVSFVSLIFTNRIIKSDMLYEDRIKYYKSENEICILASLWLSALSAIYDEYHQLFIIGRDGSFLDVCIDAIGIVTVLLIIKIVFTIRMIRFEKRIF